MSSSDPPVNNSPAELVAIARAAHVVGDRQLEKAARRDLLARFGIRIRFPANKKTDPKGGEG